MENNFNYLHAFGEILRLIPKYIFIFIFGILIISTYWFCSIFLIANTFYSLNSIYLIFAFSFILSTSWLLLAVILTALQSIFIEKYVDKEYDSDLESILFASVLTSIMYLSTILFIGHYCRLNFFSFLILALGFILVGFLRILIGTFIIKKTLSNSNNKVTP
jgi:hypothetical protein